MKKIITGSLITAIISNNIAYANELENELEDINENIVISTTTNLEQEKEEIIENQEDVINIEEEKQQEKTGTYTPIQDTTINTIEVSVSDFKGLQDALKNTSNKIINITEDIEFTENLIIPANNKDITINGNGKKFLLNKNQINVRAEGAKLNNIKFEDYTSQAISIYNTKNVTLEKIKLIGTVGQSSCGIDIGASDNSTSSVILSNITSKNHKSCGIRLKNGSSVEFKGGNIHINDKQDLQVILKDGQSNEGIDDKLGQYVDRKTSDNKNIYYTCHNTIDVSNFEQLKEAISLKRATINIKNDIDLKEELKLETNISNFTINGDGNKIISNNGSKITIKGNNIELNDMKFENYKNQAIFLYSAKDVLLKNIELIGDGVNSKVGIEIGGNNTKGSTNIKLENITSKNNLDCGIKVRNQSSIKILGTSTHVNDKQDLYLIDEEGKKNEIIDTNNQYVKLNEKVDEANKKTYIYYGIHTNKVVDDFKTLKDALQAQNSTITLGANITLEEDLDITKGNITINGNGYTIKSGNKQKSANSKDTYKLSIKAPNTTIKNLKFENYLSNALTVYSAENVTLSNLTFIGNDVKLTNEERSKVGIDIYKSTVKLDNITSKNHLYRGIQVRNSSTVEVLSKNTHENDSIHMQTIKSTGEENSIIKDISGYYVFGTGKENNGKITVDYYSKKDININDAKDFINNLQNSGNVLHLKKNIVFTESDLVDLNGNTELIVSPNVTIIGDGNTIDLSNLATITLKGNDIRLENLTIRNSKDIGVNIYNSRDVMLDNVKIIDSTRYGIFVNGSKVKLKNCYTSNNDEGGIMITRSRALRGSSYIDSYVEVIDSIKHDEPNINVAVKNLEMIDGYFQDNEFIAPDNIYNKYQNDKEYKVLSDYYLDLFGIVGEARNKKYKEQSEDYMIIQKTINVQENNEVLNPDGTPIRLAGDGITDETENIEKLIEYAASHGRELYFPKGIYKITRDIDLSKINLPAQSNFTITGDKDNLVIFDGSSSTDRMLKIKNEEYKYQMNYININNIVFNNIGVEINGPYKKGISLNNNAFINGKYTREVNSSGNITKATMEPYIIAKNNKYLIENNIFLRDKNNPGRGISTYRTKNTTIKNNYFGNLEGISDASGMLPKDVIDKLNMIKDSSKDLNLSGSQGNFFTAINNERYDENIDISNNYFNMDKTRNITSDFGENVLISGINVSKEGQRRDHIIYSKVYNGLNIYGNYFKGMENSAAGGVKIRNGKSAYIGSNHFDDVPLLTYIYGDLTKAESLLYDTTIYNNLFHCKTNFGGEGTGILYYQSFRDGDNLTFKDGDTWTSAFGDVKNFVIYNNKFMSDDRDLITISGRAETAYNNNEFLAHGNKYFDKDMLVNYRVSGNYELSESRESDILNKLNNGYKQYKDISIPLTPATVDYKYINEELDKAKVFYEYIENKSLIGRLCGQYSEDIVKELKELLLETIDLIKEQSLNQWETNKRLTLIQDTLEKLKRSILPIIDGTNDITIKLGDLFDTLSGVKAFDKEDGDITKDIKVTGSVDVNVEGKYELTYTVTDSDGNKTEVKREVVVNSIKIEINNAPTIEANDKTIKVGDKFNPLEGVSAFDAEDGDITDKIKVVSNNVNTSKTGNYEVVYKVIDSKGVLTTKVISVIVVSYNKPVIIGVEDIEIIKGSNFDPMEGVSAFDYEDGDITEKIIILGSVNTNKPGEYNIIYRFSDKENNITEFIRQVLVYDNKFNLVDNPKTGEENTIVWLATGALALIGMIILNRKKNK